MFYFRPNLSFNFHFFLHGTSTVCASIDVQQHKDIFHLTQQDFEQNSPINGKNPSCINCLTRIYCHLYNSLVILASYGLSAVLVGCIQCNVDINLLRKNWEQHYSLRYFDDVPDFVEIKAGR
jgi:mediator of RNA polymerase II transcription subunit 13